MTPPPSADPPEFIFGSGFRVIGATNAQPGVDPVTGQVHIDYVDHATNQSRVAVSSDGLAFPAGTSAAGVFRNDARNTLLTGGSWRIEDRIGNALLVMLSPWVTLAPL